MRHTFLEQNPFYILEVSPGEKRASIIAKAEEKAFFSEGNECEDAQSSLINPARRVSAELEWFFGLTVNQQADIINSIQNNKEISTDGMSGISRLNALVYNFSVCELEDYYEIGYAILEIDELYDALSTLGLCETINKYRTQSGIAPVTESDVIDGLGKRRTAIRQIITATLETLTDADYIELVSMIAEKCIADENYDDGVIIGDVIDQYEVRMKSAIDDKMEAALALIGKVNTNTTKPVVDLTVKNLISTLKEFDKYAQPLQVKSSMDGADHEQSLRLARECREFAIELHNEYDCTDASFKLIRALREIFPELTEFAEIIANDEKQITKIRKDREQFKKDLEANRQANKHYTVNIQGNRFAIPPFCTCCMKPTTNKENVSYSSTTQRGRTQTTRSISVDMPICDECLKHRTQYNWLLVLICSISIIIGSIFMAILMAVGTDGFLSFLLGAGAAVGAYFGISAIWKTKPLEREHARRGKSASIFSLFMNSYMSSRLSSCSGVIFTFYNWEYAHLFREANKDIASEVKESPDLNTARSTSVLDANEHPVANMFKMIGVFIVAALIIGSVISSSGYSGTNNSSNSSYNNSTTSSKTYTITLSKQGGSGGTSSVSVKRGDSMPYATAPTKSGYTFGGYYSSTNGTGTKYYDANMRSVRSWDKSSNTTLYAYWISSGTSSNKITLTSSNFEDYFTITTSAEYVGNKVTISYSIKPKSTSYAANSLSSSSITHKLKGGVYLYQFSTTPTSSNSASITLNKSSGYKASGTITITVSTSNDEIYWGTEVTSCSGTIGK